MPVLDDLKAIGDVGQEAAGRIADLGGAIESVARLVEALDAQGEERGKKNLEILHRIIDAAGVLQQGANVGVRPVLQQQALSAPGDRLLGPAETQEIGEQIGEKTAEAVERALGGGGGLTRLRLSDAF